MSYSSHSLGLLQRAQSSRFDLTVVWILNPNRIMSVFMSRDVCLSSQSLNERTRERENERTREWEGALSFRSTSRQHQENKKRTRKDWMKRRFLLDISRPLVSPLKRLLGPYAFHPIFFVAGAFIEVRLPLMCPVLTMVAVLYDSLDCRWD